MLQGEMRWWCEREARGGMKRGSQLGGEPLKMKMVFLDHKEPHGLKCQGDPLDEGFGKERFVL
jgi:hypothetical protein